MQKEKTTKNSFDIIIYVLTLLTIYEKKNNETHIIIVIFDILILTTEPTTNRVPVNI